MDFLRIKFDTFVVRQGDAVQRVPLVHPLMRPFFRYFPAAGKQGGHPS